MSHRHSGSCALSVMCLHRPPLTWQMQQLNKDCVLQILMNWGGLRPFTSVAQILCWVAVWPGGSGGPELAALLHSLLLGTVPENSVT